MKKKILYILLIFLIFLKPNYSQSLSREEDLFGNFIEDNYAEYINNYNVDLYLNKDGSGIVTEEIDFITNYNNKHGIYRDIPYKIEKQNIIKYTDVAYKLISVTRNGHNEEVKKINDGFGVRYRIGSPDYYINSGLNTYIIKYKIYDLIKYENNHYTLKWNAIGQFWDFPINNAVININHENVKDFQIISEEAYSGILNEKNKDFTMNKDENNITYKITKPYLENQGLSIFIDFNSSDLSISETNKYIKLWIVNKEIIIGIIFTLFGIIYALFTWLFFGRDGHKGIVVPNFEVPKNASPVLTSYIYGKRKGTDLFSIGLLDLEQKGYIGLESINNNLKISTNNFSNEELSKQSNKILEFLKMFGDEYYLNDIPAEKIYNFSKHLENITSKEYSTTIYDRNIEFIFPLGIILVTGAFFIHMILGLFLFIIFVIYLSSFKDKDVKKLYVPFFIVVITFVVIGVDFVKKQLISNDIMYVFFVVIAALLFIFYSIVIGKPRKQGIETINQIEGLEMFIETADEERLKKVTSYDELELLYKRLLPYAMAIGVGDIFIKKIISQIKKYYPNNLDRSLLYFERERIYYSTSRNNYRSLENSHRAYLAKESMSSMSSRGGGGFSGGGSGGGGGGSW